MKKNIVTHPGIIKNINGETVEVAIIVKSGCASCEIKGACSVSDISEKSVKVRVPEPNQFKPNQNVTIEMQQSLGTWAVLLGYIFPFLVLLVSLIIFLNIGLDQGMAGLLSLFLLIPYYLMLYMFRNYLGSKFSYNIRP